MPTGETLYRYVAAHGGGDVAGLDLLKVWGIHVEKAQKREEIANGECCAVHLWEKRRRRIYHLTHQVGVYPVPIRTLSDAGHVRPERNEVFRARRRTRAEGIFLEEIGRTLSKCHTFLLVDVEIVRVWAVRSDDALVGSDSSIEDKAIDAGVARKCVATAFTR